MSSTEDARKLIHESVDKMITEIDPPKEEDGPALLKAWITVAAIKYADGGNQVYLLAGDASGDPLSLWEKEGLLHYALYGWESSGDSE